jgi:hypothetical protein
VKGASDPTPIERHDDEAVMRPPFVPLPLVDPRTLSAVLDRVSYRLLAVEIDVDAGRARVEVRRHDGYTLTLDVRNGEGTITRERLRRETIAVGRRGDRYRAERLSMSFLGRTRVTGGARAALRAYADVIGDNAPDCLPSELTLALLRERLP